MTASSHTSPASAPAPGTEPSPGPASAHWAALDGLRGLAVLAVVGYHFGVPGFSGGFLGVDVFFVVSGCVVTVSWRRMRREGPAARRFYHRRAVRLLPNLFAYLAVAVAWNTWHDRSLLTEANALLLAAAAQVVNIATSFADPSITTSTHLWSLSIEWQFYLLLPLLLMPLWHRPGDTRSRLGLVSGVALASMLLRPALGAADVDPWQIYHWTITRLDGLALGVAAGLLLERPSRAARRWSASVALLAIAVAIVATPDWWSDPRLSLYVSITAVCIASYVLVRGITTGRAAVPLVGALASRPLRWIGERSYSIYLWHFFIGVVVIADGSEDWQGLPVFAAQMAASLAVAVAAYEFVEKPCRARYTPRAKVTSGDASPITAG